MVGLVHLKHFFLLEYFFVYYNKICLEIMFLKTQIINSFAPPPFPLEWQNELGRKSVIKK